MTDEQMTKMYDQLFFRDLPDLVMSLPVLDFDVLLNQEQ
jgi:hypothetical protein